jgi:hypothetical protein
MTSTILSHPPNTDDKSRIKEIEGCSTHHSWQQTYSTGNMALVHVTHRTADGPLGLLKPAAQRVPATHAHSPTSSMCNLEESMKFCLTKQRLRRAYVSNGFHALTSDELLEPARSLARPQNPMARYLLEENDFPISNAPKLGYYIGGLEENPIENVRLDSKLYEVLQGPRHENSTQPSYLSSFVPYRRPT